MGKGSIRKMRRNDYDDDEYFDNESHMKRAREMDIKNRRRSKKSAYDIENDEDADVSVPKSRYR